MSESPQFSSISPTPGTVSPAAAETHEMNSRLVSLELEIEQLRAKNGTQAERIGELERHLQWLEQMSGLKLVIRGVAHEINNLLTGALGFTHLLGRSTLKTDARELQMLSTVSDELNRCAVLTRNLLQYAHTFAAPEEGSFDLLGVVQEVMEQFRKEVDPKRIVLTMNAEEGLAPLAGNREQARNATYQLLKNAREAIERLGRSGGWIEARLRTEDDAVLLEVSDSGGGVADPERIFQPFYSTREVGQPGTGLGLTMVQSIMRDQGGRVYLKRGDEGAIFCLRFLVAGPERSLRDSGAKRID